MELTTLIDVYSLMGSQLDFLHHLKSTSIILINLHLNLEPHQDLFWPIVCWHGLKGQTRNLTQISQQEEVKCRVSVVFSRKWIRGHNIAWSLKASKALRVDIGPYLLRCIISTPLESQVARVGRFLMDENRGVSWPFCRLL